MKALIFFFVLSLQPLHTAIHWPQFIAEFQERPYTFQHRVMEAGASNINYQVELEGLDYCVRTAPKSTPAVYSDLEIEYQVLCLLSKLNVSAQPVYFDRDRRTLVTYFIPNINEPINLLDAHTRLNILTMLHQIENADLNISRVFKPYRDVTTLVRKSQSTSAPPFSNEFHEILLPALKQIDSILSQNPRQSLCHLDLHSKNVLKDHNRFWILDWEYAAMSHPYLVLASMASIERWNDAQMKALLLDYEHSATDKDFHTLYLYRIVADIFWTAWNHIQAHCSPIKKPYTTWGDLFEKAALQRVQSQEFQNAIITQS